MKYRKFIPVITFIIGGGIGIKCGAKYVLHIQEQFLKFDECKKCMEKVFEKILDDMRTEVMKES